MKPVDKFLERFDALEGARRPWEHHWEDIARYVAPSMALREIYQRLEGEAGEPYGSYRSPNLYDHTSLMAIDRLSSGEISLVMPTGQKWHTLKSTDAETDEATDEEMRWFDRMTNYLFRMRYNPQTGFQSASKAATKCRAGFGTAVMYIEEAMGRGVTAPMSYRYVPLLENYLSANFEGVVDTNYRLFYRTPRQCVERWGSACSEKTKKANDDPKKRDTAIPILHAVEPLKTPKIVDGADGVARVYNYSSTYIEKDERHIIGSAYYVQFPYIVFHWNRESQGPYCEGPVSLAISEIKSLNMLSKQEYIATQQWVNPPTAQIDDAFNTPNLNPGAPNPGLLSDTGELLIKPITTVQRPDFARAIVEAKQNNLREALYVNLWQILISNPQMTATEALIRAQEKADLLGPAGLSLQDGLSKMVDREFSILTNKGIFRPDKALAPPPSLENRELGVQFMGPLDKMRRASEVIGMQRVLETAGIAIEMTAQANPQRAAEIIERFDFDEILDIAQDIHGAPRKMFKPVDAANAGRANLANMQQLMMAVSGAKAGGDAAKSVGEGVTALKEAQEQPQQ